MVNNLTSSCKHCMFLIRLQVLNGLLYNTRIYVKSLSTKDNYLADALLRLKLDKFKSMVPPSVNEYPYVRNQELWPPQRIFRAAFN